MALFLYIYIFGIFALFELGMPIVKQRIAHKAVGADMQFNLNTFMQFFFFWYFI